MSQQRHPGVDLDAVLDAAASCYLRFGVAKTTAADIAQVVGISRATLYRRFGSHEAIFLAVLARESDGHGRRCRRASRPQSRTRANAFSRA